MAWTETSTTFLLYNETEAGREYNMALEDGYHILLETGYHLLSENFGAWPTYAGMIISPSVWSEVIL